MIEEMATELALVLGGGSDDWRKYELICRRALERVRRPTLAMIDAVGDEATALVTWTKMMDVALGDDGA